MEAEAVRLGFFLSRIHSGRSKFLSQIRTFLSPLFLDIGGGMYYNIR